MSYAIISGASQGIGKSIAEKMAKEGQNLILLARNIKALKEIKADLEKRFSIKIEVAKLDVTSKEEIKECFDSLKPLLPKVEILINNAGTFIPGKIEEEDDGALEQMIETNLYSAYNISRAVLPFMKEKESGHIFNMCSIASLNAYENGGSYSISKFALLGFSKCLRQEVMEYGIKVTQIMPGATLTPSWDGVDFPHDRFMKPEDIADIIWATYTLSKNTTVEDIVLRPQLGDL